MFEFQHIEEDPLTVDELRKSADGRQTTGVAPTAYDEVERRFWQTARGARRMPAAGAA